VKSSGLYRVLLREANMCNILYVEGSAVPVSSGTL
jgi:hypothetical protein